jgi:hypothetical protein
LNAVKRSRKESEEKRERREKSGEIRKNEE